MGWSIRILLGLAACWFVVSVLFAFVVGKLFQIVHEDWQEAVEAEQQCERSVTADDKHPGWPEPEMKTAPRRVPVKDEDFCAAGDGDVYEAEDEPLAQLLPAPGSTPVYELHPGS